MCTPDRDRLADWLAGWLDQAAAARTAAHVAACPACRAEADALLQLATAVRAEAAQRAERAAVPAYRLPPTATTRPATLRHVVLPLLKRATQRRATAAPRLRVAAGLMAAVALATSTVVWRAGSPMPVGRGSGDRLAGGGREVQAPFAPTVVVREATVVHRAALRALGVQTPRAAEPVVAVSRRDPGAVPPVAARPIVVAAPPAAGPLVIADAPATSPERDRERHDVRPSLLPSPLPSATAAVVPTTAPIEPTSPVPPTLPAPTAALPVPTTQAPFATPTAVVPTIAGLVIGANGGPLPGARVVVEPYGGGPISAVTAADGRYAVAVTPGRWLVHAAADGHALMWRGGAPSPLSAEAIDVSDGSQVAVDFALEPAPGLAIRGRVVDAAGNGVPGALVVAARPGDRAVDAGSPTAAAYADGDGNYALPITPGSWLVAATTDWRRGALAWWGGDGSILQADRVAVDFDILADGIDVLVHE